MAARTQIEVAADRLQDPANEQLLALRQRHHRAEIALTPREGAGAVDGIDDPDGSCAVEMREAGGIGREGLLNQDGIASG